MDHLNLTEKALQEVREKLPEVPVSEWEPMAAHCSFRTGGAVRAVAYPQEEASLRKLCTVLKNCGSSFLLLGNGTNMVFPDEESPNLFVISTGRLQELLLQEDGTVYASAGVPMSRLAAFACEQELTGLEFASGIPGSVGGGVLMNAGAYGGELKDVIASVRVCTPDGLEISLKKNEDCGFGYRRSCFQKDKSIILGASFRLEKGNRENIAAKMKELNQRRRDKQPLELPSAGSTFRRPEGYFAAALIEECGMKGFSIGGAQVSAKHAGFIVNTGNAKTEDLRQLIRYVQNVVWEKKQVHLEPEVILVQGEV